MVVNAWWQREEETYYLAQETESQESQEGGLGDKTSRLPRLAATRVLQILQPSEMASPAGDQVFKHLGIHHTFHIQSTSVNLTVFKFNQLTNQTQLLLLRVL